VLERTGIESADMYVAFVPQASSEWRAGLRPGDRITTLDGARSASGARWRTARRRRRQDARAPVDARRHPMRGFFQLRKEQWDDEFGQHYERYVFRTDHWLCPAPDRSSPTRTRSGTPAPGVEETGSVIKFIASGCCGSCQGRVLALERQRAHHDVRHRRAGGRAGHRVLRVGDGAHLGEPRAHQPPAHPVLDGGHLLFFLFEAARRRPLPLRIREVASLVGMMMLVLLMLVAFKNDVERRWDVIVTAGARAHGRDGRARHRHAGARARGQRTGFRVGALEAELARAVQLDARDRALATELVYGSLRVQPWLMKEIGPFAPRGIDSVDARVRAHLVVAAYQLFFTRVPAFAAVSEAVEPCEGAPRRARGLVRERGLRKVAARAATMGEADRGAALVDVDAGVAARGSRAGADARRARAFLSFRVEPLRSACASRARRARRLARALREPRRRRAASSCGRLSPLAILARGAGKPQKPARVAARERGRCRKKARSSRRSRSGRGRATVLDACAGRGNKTAVLARAVGTGGASTRATAIPSKLERLGEELSRIGLARALRSPSTGRSGRAM
jgi:hypothetical protein